MVAAVKHHAIGEFCNEQQSEEILFLEQRDVQT